MIDPRTELWAMDKDNLRVFVENILDSHRRRQDELSAVARGDRSILLANAAANDQHIARQPNTDEAKAYFAGQGRWHQYDVIDGTAIIDIKGPVMHTVHWVYRYFGIEATDMTEMRAIVEEIGAAGIKTIHMRVNSPGGTVSGTKELADALTDYRTAGGRVVTHAEGCMASAALWIGLMADRVGATEMTYVGSLGVYRVMYDYSAYARKEGIAVTVIANDGATVKGAGVFGTEITDEVIADGKRVINAINDKFITAVAKARGMTEDAVRAINTGQVWLAADAKARGLIDGVFKSIAESDPPQAIDDDDEAPPESPGPAAAATEPQPLREHPQASTPAQQRKGTSMDPKILDLIVAETAHASLIRDMATQGKDVDAIKAAIDQAKAADAAEAERAALVKRADDAEAALATVTAERDALAADLQTEKATTADLEARLTKLQNAQAGAADDVGAGDGEGNTPKTITSAEFHALEPSRQAELREQGYRVIYPD